MTLPLDELAEIVEQIHAPVRGGNFSPAVRRLTGPLTFLEEAIDDYQIKASPAALLDVYEGIALVKLSFARYCSNDACSSIFGDYKLLATKLVAFQRRLRRHIGSCIAAYDGFQGLVSTSK